MSEPSLIVVRGAYRGTDPTYACTAHDTQKGRYALLEVQDGRVTKRTLVPASDRATVEEAMQQYRGVTVDAREDAALVRKLNAPAHAVQADEAFFAGLRRAKSDEELRALTELHAATRARLDDDYRSTSTFRGAAQKEGNKSAFEVTKARGFTQYRGGMQDAKGRVSDLTRVEAKTPEWEARLARVERGFRAVENKLCVGALAKDLDDAFMAELDQDKDYVYGSVVHHTGFESHETSVPLDRVERYDFLTVGAAVGDGSETALVYRGGRAMTGEEGETTYGAHVSDAVHATNIAEPDMLGNIDDLFDKIAKARKDAAVASEEFLKGKADEMMTTVTELGLDTGAHSDEVDTMIVKKIEAMRTAEAENVAKDDSDPTKQAPPFYYDVPDVEDAYLAILKKAVKTSNNKYDDIKRALDERNKTFVALSDKLSALLP